MSGASNPRETGLYRDAVIAARTVLEDFDYLPSADNDELADAIAERLLGDFLAMAEADSRVVFGVDGVGPFCSWCGRIPGPRLPAGHPQRGVFCECRREHNDAEEPGEMAGSPS